jgi:hypothetical protein
MTDRLTDYANSGGIIYSHYDAEGRQTHVVIDGVKLAVYPVLWCPVCGGERPCAGPYCQVCGSDIEEAP